MLYRNLISTLLLLMLTTSLIAQDKNINRSISASIEDQIKEHSEMYIDLHMTPELSLMEKETSAKMAAALKTLGFDVTTNFGGYGLVGIFKNGDGPVLMLRTDMDALPIKELTGLSFASKVVMNDYEGNKVPVMHACGHDMHMTLWLGTLNTLVNLKDSWHGTIVAIAQPAEEISGGSSRMIAEGLFTKFPTPDYALAYHVSAELAAGTIGYFPGAIFAGVNSADITVYGQGGHGAAPHTTIDPIVLSASIINSLQTIVSREINPVYPAVVTVGSIHGGTKHNIIPEEVKMQLTLRFFTDDVYKQIQESLLRITEGHAIAAGLTKDKYPKIEMADQYTPPVYNNQDLVEKSVSSMKDILGSENIIKVDPATVAEDFGKFGLTEEKVKIALFWCGSVGKERYNKYQLNGDQLPGLHNPAFFPDFDATYRSGVAAMTRTMIDLFNNY